MLPSLKQVVKEFQEHDNGTNLANIETAVGSLSHCFSSLTPAVFDIQNGKMYLKLVSIKPNQTTLAIQIALTTAQVGLSLQVEGSHQIVASVLVLDVKMKGTIQRQQTSSVISNQLMGVGKVKHIIIGGWDVSNTATTLSAKNPKRNQLRGNVTFSVEQNSEHRCRIISSRKEISNDKHIHDINPACQFVDKVSGKYSSKGCITIPDPHTGSVTCRCNHLSIFAVLLAVEVLTIPYGVKV